MIGMGGVVAKTFDRTKMRVKQMLSVPVLQCSKEGQYVEFIIDTTMRRADPLETDKKPDGTLKKEPPTIANVTQIREDGTTTPAIFLFAAVVKNEIEKLYPNGGYVGHAFAVKAMDKPEGKKFRPYMVAELDLGQ